MKKRIKDQVIKLISQEIFPRKSQQGFCKREKHSSGSAEVH